MKISRITSPGQACWGNHKIATERWCNPTHIRTENTYDGDGEGDGDCDGDDNNSSSMCIALMSYACRGTMLKSAL